MIDADEMLHRQRVLAEFGGVALKCDDLQRLLTEACRLIGRALGTEFAKVIEIEPDRGTAVVRAGIGWNAGIVGQARIQLDERSSEAYAIHSGEPLITNDIAQEHRFAFPDFMREHGVVALVNVPIVVPGQRPFGVLQVDSCKPREFDRADIDFLRTYATVLGLVIDRLRKARDLAHTTEKYRLIIENARDYAIFLTDQQDQITDWLAGAEAVYGWKEAEILGKPAEILFTPEDRRAGAPRWEIETARREGKAPNVRWHVRKDGSGVFIDGQTTALRSPDGALNGFMKIGQDVTERRRDEESLRTNEARLRLALETARLATWDWDLPTDRVEWSDEHYRLQGYEVGEIEPSYAAWAERLHPDDRQAVERALAESREQRQPYVNEFRTVHPDGSVRWCSARGRYFYDDSGRPSRMIGVMQDVTERREWEQRQQVLLAELQHRTRNLIGVVRSLADKTSRTSTDLTDFRNRFGDRLDALARVQGLLSRLNDGDRIAFDQLLAVELAAMDGVADRVTLHGPTAVKVRSSTVQVLAMALHELATNAVKYGALGQPQGSLTITCRLEPRGADGKPWLHIDWRETDVTIAPESIQTPHRGQGRELIEHALPYQLGARTRYTLTPHGVHCEVSVPVSASTRNEDERRG